MQGDDDFPQPNLNDLKFMEDIQSIPSPVRQGRPRKQPSFLDDVPMPPPLPMDGSEAAQHDQLPSVEEYKTTLAIDNKGSNDQDRKALRQIIILIVILVVSVLSVILGLMLSSEEATKEEQRVHATSSPVASPVETPSTELSRKYYIEKMVVENGWSELEDVTNPDTPQSKAVTWMADFDDRELEIKNWRQFRERYSLTVLYFAWNGDSWRNNLYWLKYHHHCNWWSNISDTDGNPVQVGIRCNTKDAVAEIFMSENEMVGTIPREIKNFHHLVTLDVSGAGYLESGADGIPFDALAELTSLRTLNLRGNLFNQELGDVLGTIATITSLNLADNEFYGTVPENIAQNLNDLIDLNIENNKFTGPMDSFKDLLARSFLAGGNEIEGEFTEDIISSWKRLEALDLSDNNISGHLPVGLFAHQTVRVLDLHGNNFDGPIPHIFSTQSKLVFLALQDNNLTGPVGEKLTLLAHLQHLDLSNNNLDGDMPGDFTGIPNLRYLFMAFNDGFTPGPIPTKLGELPHLEDLSLQGTRRTGLIPTELGQLGQLRLLDLVDNGLTGDIPSQLTGASELRYLILKGNKLSGGQYNALATMDHLTMLVVHDNPMNGTANALCDSATEFTIPTLKHIVADCASLHCECCSCCDSEEIEHKFDQACLATEWYNEVDPVNSKIYAYQRGFYAFHHLDLVFPSDTEDLGLADLANDTSPGERRHLR